MKFRRNLHLASYPKPQRNIPLPKADLILIRHQLRQSFCGSHTHHCSMERSRKFFLKLASASHQVITAANKYADCKGMCGVQRSHFRLESEMRRVSIACEYIIDILRRSSLPDGPAFDVRLQDWLCTDEPQMCLDTLSQMETLLRKDSVSSWKSIFLRGRAAMPTQDKMQEAADLFDSRKTCFYFLSTTEIWWVSCTSAPG